MNFRRDEKFMEMRRVQTTSLTAVSDFAGDFSFSEYLFTNFKGEENLINEKIMKNSLPGKIKCYGKPRIAHRNA